MSLKSRSDFERLRNDGYKIRPCAWMIFSYNFNTLSYPRCGWTFPKYVGNAVVRNRLRRWSRDFVRTELKRPIDFNLVLLRQEKDFYKNVSREEYLSQLQKAVTKIEAKFNKTRS